jgi:hypothetical protein
MESFLKPVKDFETPISSNNLSYTKKHKSSSSKMNSKKTKVYCNLILEHA